MASAFLGRTDESATRTVRVAAVQTARRVVDFRQKPDGAVLEVERNLEVLAAIIAALGAYLITHEADDDDRRTKTDSVALAQYYAAKRGVATNRLVGLSLPTTELISRADYEARLQKPLVSELIAPKSSAPTSPLVVSPARRVLPAPM